MVSALLFLGALCHDQGHITLSVASAMVSALLFLGALCHDQGHVTLCLLLQQWSVHCCFRAPFALGTMGHQSEGGCTLHCLLLRPLPWAQWDTNLREAVHSTACYFALDFFFALLRASFFLHTLFLGHSMDASFKKQDTSVVVEIQWGNSKHGLEPSHTRTACTPGLSTTATSKTVWTSDFIAKSF